MAANQSSSNEDFYQLTTLDALLSEVHAKPDNDSDDPLDILVSLTQTGRIDPWNIDLVAIADEYLRAISQRQQQANDGGDLKVTGKSLLYLAILLRMKSDHLAGQTYLDEVMNPQHDEDWLDDEGDLAWGEQLQVDPDWLRQMVPYQSLEAMIERRSSTKAKRIRPVTINDLIAELKKAEEAESQERYKRQVARVDRVRDVSRLTAKQIENLAHEEFIEENIITLQGLLKEILTNPNHSITLSELMTKGQLDRVSAYLALLFLSARGELDLVQDEFYGDIGVTSPGEQQPAT
jgi:segregation and condensation protein A